MLAGRMGPGGMRPSEVRKTESSASSEVSVQVQKEDYQKLMEKKAPVVAKKKPKKKGFFDFFRRRKKKKRRKKSLPIR